MDKELRNKMSQNGNLLIDGIGRERVVTTFQTLKRKEKGKNEKKNITINI